MIDDLEALDAELEAVGLDTDTGDLDDPMADLSLGDEDDEDLGDLEGDLDEDDPDEDDPDDDPADDGDAESAGDGTDNEDLAAEDPEDVDDEPAVLASTILEEELDDEATVLATVFDDDEDEDEVREGEFVCRSCFMAKRETALADEDAMLCLDCV